MRSIQLNIHKSLLLIFVFYMNHFQGIYSGDNIMDFKMKSNKNQKHTENVSSGSDLYLYNINKCSEYSKYKNCTDLSVSCMVCQLNPTCTYGAEITTLCTIKNNTACKGNNTFTKKFICRYCYQTEKWEHTCKLQSNCSSVATPPQYYTTECWVREDIICFGNRNFLKNIACNWTRGYSWKAAMLLSITLGGFGADRFYLGHWQEAIGKLFSFGGIGFWTLIDTILISLHYLGPADGSLYL